MSCSAFRIRLFGISLLRLCLSGLPVLSLAACSLAPAYVRPEAPVPAKLTSMGVSLSARDNLQATDRPADSFRTGWRDFFRDERLLAVIAAAMRTNRDLRVAALSVAEAGARLKLQNAERFPRLEAEGSDIYSGNLRGRPAINQFEATGMASFELDLFGRLKSMNDAALHAYLGAQEGEKAVRIALVSQVARAYLEERLAVEQRQLAADTLKSLKDSHAFIEGRVQSGQSSLLDLEQARSMVESATAAVAQREREIVLAHNALQFLLGDFTELALPDAVRLAKQSLAELPQGVDSKVLLGRPDIMEAEHNLMSANADIGAARAAFFPSISLTGNLGYMSDDLKTLFSGTTSFWSFLPAIRLPIFTGGQNTANLELAEIRKESSVIQYEQAIQTAFREVADALLNRTSFVGQFRAQERYLAAQRQVQSLALNQYINGAVSYLEVLDAQRNVFQAEQDLLLIRRDQLLNDITLYSSLGGGLY